jgi:hypothetical protein
MLVLLFAVGAIYATDKRVQALGNNAYMLLGDDASIQLFPQRINDMNLVYFEDIHLANPNYLLVVGDQEVRGASMVVQPRKMITSIS